jgi:hypothetical protein
VNEGALHSKQKCHVHTVLLTYMYVYTTCIRYVYVRDSYSVHSGRSVASALPIQTRLSAVAFRRGFWARVWVIKYVCPVLLEHIKIMASRGIDAALKQRLRTSQSVPLSPRKTLSALSSRRHCGEERRHRKPTVTHTLTLTHTHTNTQTCARARAHTHTVLAWVRTQQLKRDHSYTSKETYTLFKRDLSQ